MSEVRRGVDRGDKLSANNFEQQVVGEHFERARAGTTPRARDTFLEWAMSRALA